MKNIIIFIIYILYFSGYSQNPITIGETTSIYSEILDEDRKLEIYLPEDYSKSDKNYPVLYLLDSYYNFTHTVGTVKFLRLNRLIPNLIIVGIRNTNRNRDLSPNSSEISIEEQNRMGASGQADNFLAFIEKELIPYVDTNYKSAKFKLIAGHSRGGLFNVYTFFKKPTLFNAYITISPSLWYSNNLISKQLNNDISVPTEINPIFYMTLANEKKGEMRGNILKLSGNFKNYINANKGTYFRFKYEQMFNESHGSTNLPSLYNGLRYIFEPTQYEIPRTKEEIMAEGGPDAVIENVKAYYSQLFINYQLKISDEYALTNLGYAFLKIKDFRKNALDAFKRAAETNPDSYDAYSNIGMAYEELDQLEKARHNYKKALKMIKKTDNPEWEFYKADLDNLEKKIKSNK